MTTDPVDKASLEKLGRPTPLHTVPVPFVGGPLDGGRMGLTLKKGVDLAGATPALPQRLDYDAAEHALHLVADQDPARGAEYVLDTSVPAAPVYRFRD